MPVAVAVIDIMVNDDCMLITRTFIMCDDVIYGQLCKVYIHTELYSIAVSDRKGALLCVALTFPAQTRLNFSYLSI